MDAKNVVALVRSVGFSLNGIGYLVVHGVLEAGYKTRFETQNLKIQALLLRGSRAQLPLSVGMDSETTFDYFTTAKVWIHSGATDICK